MNSAFMPPPCIELPPVLCVVVVLDLSCWLIDGLSVDVDGFGDWASAVPIANALTAEINASFLSIVGLRLRIDSEGKAPRRGGWPPAGGQLASGRAVPARSWT